MDVNASVLGLRILFIVLLVGWFFFRMIKRRKKKRSIKEQRQLWREGFRERREARLRSAKTWGERKSIDANKFPAGSVGSELSDQGRSGVDEEEGS